MKIDDPLYVLKLWASSVRPRLRMYQHRDPARGKINDDRRIQARAKVESTPGFRKAQPVLILAYVNDATPTMIEQSVIDAFLSALGEELAERPIIVADDPPVTSDFYLPTSKAVERLAKVGTPISLSKLEKLVNEGAIGNYKEGRQRMVKWSDVVLYAPRRKRRLAA